MESLQSASRDMTTVPTEPGSGLSSPRIFITIMEYMLYRKKSICSKTILLRYLTSWLYQDHPDLVRNNKIMQSTPLHLSTKFWWLFIVTLTLPGSLIVLMEGELSQHHPTQNIHKPWPTNWFLVMDPINDIKWHQNWYQIPSCGNLGWECTFFQSSGNFLL